MKPLSEQAWREKIEKILKDNGCNAINEEAGCDQTVYALVSLVLQDRKAWGEYVIGGNIPFLQLNDGSSRKKQDVYASGQWHMMNRLLAAQCQRNQGEKTDE